MLRMSSHTRNLITLFTFLVLIEGSLYQEQISLVLHEPGTGTRQVSGAGTRQVSGAGTRQVSGAAAGQVSGAGARQVSGDLTWQHPEARSSGAVRRKRGAPFNQTPVGIICIGRGAQYRFSLKAVDSENDLFEFYADTTKPFPPNLGSVSLQKDGQLVFNAAAPPVTGVGEFHFIIQEVSGRRLRTEDFLEIELTRRNEPASYVWKGEPRSPPKEKLKMWQIGAIAAGAALFLTLLAISITWCCFAWPMKGAKPGLGSISPFPESPLRAQERGPPAANPAANPPRHHIGDREAIRAGAVDGAPLYGATMFDGRWNHRREFNRPEPRRFSVAPAERPTVPQTQPAVPQTQPVNQHSPRPDDVFKFETPEQASPRHRRVSIMEEATPRDRSVPNQMTQTNTKQRRRRERNHNQAGQLSGANPLTAATQLRSSDWRDITALR